MAGTGASYEGLLVSISCNGIIRKVTSSFSKRISFGFVGWGKFEIISYGFIWVLWCLLRRSNRLHPHEAKGNESVVHMLPSGGTSAVAASPAEAVWDIMERLK
eukprot:6449262-Amphidinium_carterae.2